MLTMRFLKSYSAIPLSHSTKYQEPQAQSRVRLCTRIETPSRIDTKVSL